MSGGGATRPAVDFAKVRVGDYVLVRLIVAKKDSTGLPIAVESGNSEIFWPEKAEIICHEPRGLKEGDRFTFVNGGNTGYIICVEGEYACVRAMGGTRPLVYALSELQRCT